MDEKQMNRLLMQKVGRKFYGHELLYSKYVPRIPESAEREYVRLVNQYMGILKDELEKELPKIKEIYREELAKERADGIRNDSIVGLFMMIASWFTRIKNRLILRFKHYDLEGMLRNIAVINRKMTAKEWEKCVRNTLGIDIREDYYLGEFYKEYLELWVSENVDLIKSIPENTLDKMKDIIYDGYTSGKTTTRMAKDIQRVYGVSKRKAVFIARDQTAKLNGQIQRAQQMDAGIQEYIWMTTGDERVRRSHQELNGKKFSWNDAPENSDGRKCHPGQDYNCRCIGRPVFNRNINLPVADDVEIQIKKNGG